MVNHDEGAPSQNESRKSLELNSKNMKNKSREDGRPVEVVNGQA